MTVSRALRDHPEVSARTRRTVLRCAEELGYKPNRWARSLVTRRTSIIGVVVPDISHSFFAQVVRGLEEVVSGVGYNLLLCESCLDVKRENAQIEMLMRSMVEGLVVASEQPPQSAPVFDELSKRGLPFVLVDRFFPEYHFSAVVVDDLQVGRLATEHLIALGHTRIAHIKGPLISPAVLRYRAYLDTLEVHQIPVNRRWVQTGTLDIEGGREAMAQLLRAKPRPTAVFTCNDPMGIGALHACRDAGLAVPGDISIVAAGNIEGDHHPNPFLTTIDWPREELGRAAGTLLLTAIRDEADPQNQAITTFSPRLLVRQSTAPPKHDGRVIVRFGERLENREGL
jgi:LacI family transcriptional regulator